MGYCTRADIENDIGATNTAKHADLDDDQVAAKILARITVVIADVTATIDDRLRGGPHTVPFTTVPTMIRRIAEKLCAAQLYESRGAKDVDLETGQAVHIYTGMKTDAESDLRAIREGSIRLDLDSTQDTPEVVTDD